MTRVFLRFLLDGANIRRNAEAKTLYDRRTNNPHNQTRTRRDTQDMLHGSAYTYIHRPKRSIFFESTNDKI